MAEENLKHITITDDRFMDDIHWKGGCVLGGGMLSWASLMFCWNSRPPQPCYNKKWKDEWKYRLENASESCVAEWLSHQTYDEFWKHGSIKENYDNIKIPVLTIGGWHDGYTNATLRMSEKLPNCKAIVGPWSHNWPDTAVPGPNFAFMDECLQFWNEHLKGKSGKITWQDTPRVRWYQCHGEVAPGPSIVSWPGLWQSGTKSYGSTETTFALIDGAKLSSERKDQRMMKDVDVTFSGIIFPKMNFISR